MSTDKYVRDTEGPPAPRVAIAVIGILLVGIIILVLIQGLRQPETNGGSIEFSQATQQVLLGQPLTVSSDDVTVYVPPNSTNWEGTISIARGEPNLFQVAYDTWTRSRVVIIEFSNFEGGSVPNISFFNPIEICFSLTEEQWRKFTLQPGLYQVQYYAAEKNPSVWEMLPMTTYPDKFQLCGQTYHLSVFGLATRLELEIPVTGATLTSTATPTPTSPVQIPEPDRNNDRERNPTPTKPPTQPPPTDPPPTEPPPTSYP